MFIDTHTHLYVKAFDSDREAMLQRALDAGVDQFYLPNIDSDSIDSMLALEAAHPGVCHAMMGLHPCSVKEDYEKQLALMEAWLSKRDFVAIGEIGIDLYWDKTFVEQQKEAFLIQAAWATERGLPFVIHSRESIDMITALIQDNWKDGMRGIYHCFTGSLKQAEAIMELGFYMGIGGVLTFKNAGLDKVLADVPLERLVLETDSPYLAPVPRRGKRNESAYIPYIATKLAEVKGISVEEVAEITTANAKKIFASTNQKP
ncbi:MAG: TatD family hydrolase [Bacteroidetes bacterium]|nr:TatD family hydrolase [Bacteroidota bacterium]